MRPDIANLPSLASTSCRSRYANALAFCCQARVGHPLTPAERATNMHAERMNAPETGPESIGQRLRRLRLERGLSQRELSSPGVSYAYISRIEAGARRPSVKALRQLARKLQVSPEYLETGSDLRDVDERELRLADAELALRLGQQTDETEQALKDVLDEATAAGDTKSSVRATVALGPSAASAARIAQAIQRRDPATP